MDAMVKVNNSVDLKVMLLVFTNISFCGIVIAPVRPDKDIPGINIKNLFSLSTAWYVYYLI